MTDAEIKSVLLKQYPFKNTLQFTLLKGGVSNDNYVFSDGTQKYVTRVCLFEPKNQIDSMIPFLKHAETTEYPAPRLVRTIDGRDYIQNKGNPIVVTTYLEGDSANNISISIQHIKSLAQLVARFHKLRYSPKNTPITLDTDYIFNLYDRVKDYKPIDKDDDSLRLIELVDVYYKKFKLAKFTDFVKNLPHGITHGDINLGNVLINGDKAISLLDFEELGVSWQLQDIAMILVTWAFPDGEPNKEYIDVFLREYNLQKPMMEIEKENIVNVVEFIAFRQCVYAKSMMSKGNMESVKEFSSYWTLLYLYENGLSLDN
jgi:Ser/Thr protein kinase RdoA (MazF antagonist)